MLNLDQSPDTNELNAVFHALSDERRRDMVVRLAEQPMTVSELAAPAGMKLPSAVKHLAVLEAGGIVISKKIGRTRTYQINPDALNTIAKWVERRRSTMNAAFDRLQQAIADIPEDGRE
jgi:DNA-binding transcriptional ArsR family regulator